MAVHSTLHFMEIAFLKLPFHFSEAKLLKDLELCNAYNFTSHFNKNDYSGEWNSIALRSQNGEMDNIFALPQAEEKYKDTALLQKCIYFKEIIDSFECEKESIRLLNLKPGSIIKEHTDYNLGYEDGIFRIHIPITTNEEVHFFINFEEVKMRPKECWYGNFNLPHSVRNDGETDRIHLVMDCLRNDWSDNLFAECGYNFEDENKQTQYSGETKLQMIEQLKLMDTETARALISELQKDL
ncbi:aspartyl/asparaginyl beta-hydroxylase domain-containing protein [Aequorivita sp. SDUM287046]|uniref:Aspartyl/asparaginyl beta-hydroxylase domain-containing protein n=1 Tax=Aequorivita aurantiaca TaxID=3053356 RepID=A0ABT8DKI9_9FLAO|nr:aspartyl/asparaginyl beta-hydroxylase domain-containing protein [Aequorivita aurantiaca]MDN3724476.1 aspartyl/asparaginyl beta-hydroxylase domain-containing protein [Aequorivita aurantiaca]